MKLKYEFSTFSSYSCGTYNIHFKSPQWFSQQAQLRESQWHPSDIWPSYQQLKYQLNWWQTGDEITTGDGRQLGLLGWYRSNCSIIEKYLKPETIHLPWSGYPAMWYSIKLKEHIAFCTILIFVSIWIFLKLWQDVNCRISLGYVNKP